MSSSSPPSGSERSRAALLRDAALERVRRTRRWVIVGTAALSAGIAALVSAVAPGRTLASSSAKAGASPVAATGRSGSAIPSLPAPASANELGLQGPEQAPSSGSQQSQPSQPSQSPAPAQAPSAPAAPPVVSGGS